MLTIEPSTTVRDLLAAYPGTVDVLLRYGMCADCRSDPPPVPLAHFAAQHCGGDVAGLLREVKAAAGAE